MNLEDPSTELREKMLDCETKEQLIELAKDEGVELTDEHIDAISGGDCDLLRLV